MVLLALEREAAFEAIEMSRQHGCAVWVGSDAISDTEFRQYCVQGVKISRFVYPLAKATAAVIDEALETIALHHPRETVWVQYCRSPEPPMPG
jgi:hypothetical protein